MSELQNSSNSQRQIAHVSVILPAYNGERFIRAAIESVQAQTSSVSEIIVVDDGSDDRSAEIAQSMGATVISQPNKGVSIARNTGIRAATHDWVAFIDHDDLWHPEKNAWQLQAIKQYPEAAVISCHMGWFADESIRGIDDDFQPDGGLGKESDGTIAYYESVSNHLPFSRMIDYTSSLLVRKEALTAVGMFAEGLRQNEDLECFLRVVARSPVAIVRRTLVQHRVHDRNTSLGDPEGARASYEKILDALRDHPARYPDGAARAYGRAFSRILTSNGRALLDRGQNIEARQLFKQSLARSFSVRALFLWIVSFLTPSAFQRLCSTKRQLLSKSH